jgi:RecA/RadA recombinase
MAKKNNKSGVGGSIFDIIKSVDDSAEILADSATAVIDDYLNTGSYIVNAALTGSLFKGVTSGRITCLAGNPGTGKTYLALSICREGQKKGYTPIYMDSEGSIDKDFVSRIGCDPSNMIIKQVTTVSEVNTFMVNVLNDINSMPKEERPKVIFVLDSIGNLSSTKEMNDTADGNGKADMTKNREIKALFRTNATALAKAQAIMVCNTHTYQTLDLFAQTKISGGSGIGYSASVTLLLSTSKLDDKQSDKIAEKKVGDFTKTGVIVTAKT